MADWKRRAERRREREAQYEAEREAEELRRIENPTIEEQISDRIDKLILSLDGKSPELEELASLLKWHVTGSQY